MSERGFSFWISLLGRSCSLPGTFRALTTPCANYLCFIQIQRPQAMSAQAACGPPIIRFPTITITHHHRPLPTRTGHSTHRIWLFFIVCRFPEPGLHSLAECIFYVRR
ncbi:hypothetical protein EJ02DRAFT_112723 [Clathrospora elynae]|uniref:Uncharacterized protein n=1 Tax=Clathrospora elynae TaxID=706981 RepID=A0A6A5S8E0_9PLEO|nr:hypothetical protein EJ02DRAFT_112723 [Clathrospora elynae]